MKFTVSLSEFQKTIAKVLPAMPRKSTLPVLEHLNFSLKGNLLKIIATDQDIIIMSSLEVIGIEDGDILVPGYKINEIVKALGDKGDFEFEADFETYAIKLKTSFGDYNMKGLDVEEYLELPQLFQTEKPQFDSDNAFSISSIPHDQIIRLAEKTVFAVSTDEFRPAMTGVLFQFRGEYINSVATDSYRLVKAVARFSESSVLQEYDVIIPARSVEILKKVDSDVLFSKIEKHGKVTHARFEFGNTIFITKILNEQFPVYDAVIPYNNPNVVKVSQKELIEAIKRVAIFTNSNSYQIKIYINENSLIIKGEDEESGAKAQEEIECNFSGNPAVFAFNIKYMEQAINNTSDENDAGNIYICFSEPNKAVIIKPKVEDEDLLMLIMPVRV